MAYVIAATWTAKPGEADRIAAILKTMTQLSRQEPGCLYYQAHAVKDSPGTFLIYEQYADEDAVERHRSSPHFKEHVVGNALNYLASREVKGLDLIEA
jgi:quinol monooxygenase YgiN